jgi:hypothetical protein
MAIFQRKLPKHFIPIDPSNAANRDWMILLEAGTIVGPSPGKLRVARSTQERKIVKKYDLLLQPKYYLDVDGYDPRIHAVYFCPQLYKYDSEKKLVPLYGEEIGKLIAQALESSVQERCPWYAPSDDLPKEPAINGSIEPELDTLVVDMPKRISAANKRGGNVEVGGRADDLRGAAEHH